MNLYVSGEDSKSRSSVVLMMRSFFDESKGGAKIVAHWKIEGDGFTEERGWIGVRPVREKMLCVELGAQNVAHPSRCFSR